MKLKFEKNKKRETFVKVDGKDFSTKDYIEMIKKIKNKEKIEVEFEEDITTEEQGNIESMINEINSIKEFDFKEQEREEENTDQYDEIKMEDIPF